MPCLSAFPEELLESILSYSLHSLPPNTWHIRSRIAVLLVSRSFYRIAIPLYYHSISIRSSTQLQCLLVSALRPNPRLASFIHHIVLPAIWPHAGELLFRSGPSLLSLDITLDSLLNSQAHDPDTDLFCKALHHLKALSHIIVRKPNNVYLTRPKLQYVLSEITNAIHNWSDLEYVDLAFRLSDDSGGTAALLSILPIPLPIHHRPRSTKLPGPVTQLTQVLSSIPKLHTFSTHLPNVWNENILRVSQNPALQRIILVDGGGDPANLTMSMTKDCAGITGTGHFLAQARRYSRLSDLIRAGTSITRSRAQTTGRPSSNSGFHYSYGHPTSASSSSSPSSSSGSYGTTPVYRPHAHTHTHAHAHHRETPRSTASSSSSPITNNSNNTSQWQISRPWERYHPSNAPSALTSASNTPVTTIPMRAPLPLSTSAP